jgi:2'-5' RNA ligase
MYSQTATPKTMTESPKPEFHRLFIAVAVPSAVRVEITKVQNQMAGLLPSNAVRWTRPEHLHLTLRFLGNVATERTDELAQTLSTACDIFTPLQLRAERIGFFPQRGFPRVLWTAVSDETQQLTQIQKAVQNATLAFSSEPAEKEFTGHITFGRAKNIRRRESDTLVKFAATMRRRVFGEWTASSIELFKSELLPDGAQHTVLTTIPLRGAE